MVKKGYPILLLVTLTPSSIPVPLQDACHESLLKQVADFLLQLEAVEEVYQEFKGKRFYFHSFLSQKRNGLGDHPLSLVPQLLHPALQICMVTLASIISSVDPMKWFMALNLQDACLHPHL